MTEYSPNNKSKNSFMSTPMYTQPTPPAASSPPPGEENPAQLAYKSLVESVFRFEQGLGADQEVGVRLVESSVDAPFYLHELGYCDPHIITFSGKNEAGETLSLIQHVTQLNVFLVALNKHAEKTVRIGYRLMREMEE